MRVEAKKSTRENDGLSKVERNAKYLALVLAFLSVFYFFIKILFL